MSKLRYYDPPFAAPSHKIARARTHVASLERITSEYLASNPATYTITPHDDLAPDEALKFDVSFRGPGHEYSAVFGDAIHNLRSALDLMATDLVRANGGNPKSVYFPFSEDAKQLDHMIKQRNFHRAGDAAVKLLKEFQPYKGGNAALRAIHDLDVQDKHVTMFPSSTTYEAGPFRITVIDGRPKLIPIGDINSNIILRFPDYSVLAGKEVIPTLHELVELTSGVVKAFKTLCEVSGIDLNAVGTHTDPMEFGDLQVNVNPPVVPKVPDAKT